MFKQFGALAFCWPCFAFCTQVQPVDFERQIKPLLSDHCYACHGPDDKARKAELRLYSREGAFSKTDNGNVIIQPGSPDGSELYIRITASDPDDLMPPPESKLSLSALERDLIRRWIEQGAEWKEHWSFSPVKNPDLPEVEKRAWPRNEIDHFILARLDKEGMAPAIPATLEKLIRRATFDLSGLPPTWEQIDDFLSDSSPDAYEKVVDRLLNSSEYGERMAANWLDLARYSDTYGYQVDRDRHVWPWRDWVIRAFNKNLPYDQFITWQLAGDLIPGASDDQILATAFNRLHPQKVEGGSVPEEFRVEYVSDRTHTFGTTFLGLALECARCHDHKYDPISQEEYYRLFAFFNNIDEAGLYSWFTKSTPTPTLLLSGKEVKAKMADAKQVIRQEEEKLAQLEAERRESEAFKTWLENRPAESRVLGLMGHFPFDEYTDGKLPNTVDEKKPASSNQANKLVPGQVGNGVQLTGDDGVGLSFGNFPRFHPFSVSLWMKTPDHKQRAVVFHRSAAWTDAGSRGYQLLIEEGKLSASLIHFWPGNAIRVKTKDIMPVNEWQHATITYDGSSRASGLRIFVNGKRAQSETVRDNLYKNITGGGGDNITIGQRMRDNGFTNGVVDEFRVFDRQLSEVEVAQVYDGESLTKLLAKPVNSLESAEREQLLAYHLSTTWDAYMTQLKRLQGVRQKQCKEADGITEIMVMKELQSHPRETFVLNRGAYDAPTKKVKAMTPAALPPFRDNFPQNRLGLARWLVSSEHPLASRVSVNRLWQICFGRGLVSTPEDFGVQGKPPTHPKLLDWLAHDFSSSGWDMKRMLKKVLMSSTYRQSTSASPELISRDPENLFLARAPSYRLPAEMIRDNALAASGLLWRQMGGASAKPYEVAFSFKAVGRDKGQGLYRRSVYTYWRRTGPAPEMMALDASKRSVCRARREATSTPLQALVLLNSPQFVEAARALGEAMLREHGNDDASLVRGMFRSLTSREPTAAERTVLTRLFSEQLAHFEKNAKQAKEFFTTGDHPAPSDLPSARAAAAGILAKALMNFEECVVKH